jgi:hypothetical protein
MRPAAGPIPGSTIWPRLINPVGFDKTGPADERQLTILRALGRRFAISAACFLNRFKIRKQEKARLQQPGF